MRHVSLRMGAGILVESAYLQDLKLAIAPMGKRKEIVGREQKRNYLGS